MNPQRELKRMTTITGYLSMIMFILALNADAQLIPTGVTEVQRLANGRTLITDPGTIDNSIAGAVYLVNADGSLAHFWEVGTLWTHSARYLGGGEVLIADTNNDRVIRVGVDGAILWDSSLLEPFSDGSTIQYPNDAKLLANGNILISDRDHHRVIELDTSGNVVWQFGVTGAPGFSSTHLNRPHNSERLPNGNTLIPDARNDRIIEVNPAGTIVWQYLPTGPDSLLRPRDADRLLNGNTVIGDSFNARVVVVDPAGNVVHSIPTPNDIYEVDALSSGTFLVSGGGEVVEVDTAGNTLWSYPPSGNPTVQVPTIINPGSGVSLAVHIHMPAQASANNPRPVIVRVPGGNHNGQGFHSECENWARLGYIAVHFDPDGRGASTNGGAYTTEDYGGHIHQDGLHEILLHLAAMPEVDPQSIVVSTISAGIGIGSGAIARYPNNPSVALLLDWEGPADRYERSVDFGGSVPVPVTNNLFWGEREAVTFVSQITCDYVRVQSAVDHQPPHPGNFHAVAMSNAALHADFGGAGQCPHVQTGSELNNPPNQLWSVASPPVWIPESLQLNPLRALRDEFIIVRRLNAPRMNVLQAPALGGALTLETEGDASDSGANYVLALSGGQGPTRLGPGIGWVNLDPDAVLQLSLVAGALDVSGSTTTTYAIPALPALSGLALFGQAIIGRIDDPIPYALTNPVSLTIL